MAGKRRRKWPILSKDVVPYCLASKKRLICRKPAINRTQYPTAMPSFLGSDPEAYPLGRFIIA